MTQFDDGGRLLEELDALEQLVVARVRRARRRGDASIKLVGYGVARVHDGRRGIYVPFRNLVTTAGDQYYAKMGCVGVLPAALSAPTLANGMKYGDGATAVAKSGTGSALITYKSDSNNDFDSAYPAPAAVVGTDTGWKIGYSSTWAAGVATDSAIAEVVIVNDAGTNATSTSANTYSRALLSPVAVKGVDSELVIVWNHAFLGA